MPRFTVLIVLIFTLAVALICAFIAWGGAEQSADRKYEFTSTSWLRVVEHDPLLPVERPDAYERQRERRRLLATHTLLIKSYMVLNAALSEPGIADLPGVKDAELSGLDVADWLGERVQVIHGDDDPDSQIMKIQVSSDDAIEAQQLCSAVTTAYLERVVGEEKKGVLRRRDLLEKVYNRKAEELRKKREDVHELSQQIGTSDGKQATPEQALLQDYLLELRKRAVAMRLELLDKKHMLAHKEEDALSREKEEVIGLKKEIELLKCRQKDVTSVYMEVSKVLKQPDKPEVYSADLERRREELAHLAELVNKLGMKLERIQTELSAGGGDHVRLIQNARLPE